MIVLLLKISSFPERLSRSGGGGGEGTERRPVDLDQDDCGNLAIDRSIKEKK